MSDGCSLLRPRRRHHPGFTSLTKHTKLFTATPGVTWLLRGWQSCCAKSWKAATSFALAPCLRRLIRRASAQDLFLCPRIHHDQSRVVCHHYHPPGFLKQAYQTRYTRQGLEIYGSAETIKMEFTIWQALVLLMFLTLTSAQSLTITPTNTTSDPEYHAGSGIQLGIWHQPTASPVADFLVAALTQSAGTNIPVCLDAALTLYQIPPASTL